MIDSAAGGTLNTKTPKAAMELFEEMSMNSYQWHSSRAKSSKPTHVYDVDVVTAQVVQVEILTKKIDILVVTKQQVPLCIVICVEEAMGVNSTKQVKVWECLMSMWTTWEMHLDPRTIHTVTHTT